MDHCGGERERGVCIVSQASGDPCWGRVEGLACARVRVVSYSAKSLKERDDHASLYVTVNRSENTFRGSVLGSPRSSMAEMESLGNILTLTVGLQLSVAVGILLAVSYIIHRSAQPRQIIMIIDYTPTDPRKRNERSRNT